MPGIYDSVYGFFAPIVGAILGYAFSSIEGAFNDIKLHLQMNLVNTIAVWLGQNFNINLSWVNGATSLILAFGAFTGSMSLLLLVVFIVGQFNNGLDGLLDWCLNFLK